MATFFLRDLPAYGALGKGPLDPPDVHLFVRGHNIAVPASEGHFDGSVNTPGSLSDIRSVSGHLINDDCTYETLATAGEEPAPDNMVEELTNSSFIPASYIKHNQHLNRSPRQPEPPSRSLG